MEPLITLNNVYKSFSSKSQFKGGIKQFLLHFPTTWKEIKLKMGKIVEFSKLGQFIYEPIRTYSDGMLARLGFSVAIHVEPQILLIDEILAVGNVSFQKRCLEKIMEFKKRM